jgi:uncharacterized membrane protein YheB (UPF0754 family)
MMTFQEILLDVQKNWFLYAVMPVVAALIGYITKIMAIKMMFQPINFIGLKPIFGWQGIVPRKAAIMASIACDTMTTHLIKPADLFGRLDPQQVAREIEKPLLESVEDITREVAAQFQPGLWEATPEAVRKLLINRIKSEAPALVMQIMTDIQTNLESVFDLKDMVITNLLKDKPLLNRIFLEAGDKEFQFIRNSGIYFGFIIGCVQALAWAGTHSTWIMPLFGGFTGWFTDWLALKMVFNPKKPTKYLFGLFEWQGLFLKRRKEVAATYGALIAKEILTPEKLMEAILQGPLSDRVVTMVQKQVQKMIDDQSGVMKPFVVFAVGSSKYQEMKLVIGQKVMERLPQTLKGIEAYAERTMDLQNTLISKMQELNEEQFESLLRPAFEQDEWILIAVGAVLGFLVGEMQVFIMLNH